MENIQEHKMCYVHILRVYKQTTQEMFTMQLSQRT